MYDGAGVNVRKNKCTFIFSTFSGKQEVNEFKKIFCCFWKNDEENRICINFFNCFWKTEEKIYLNLSFLLFSENWWRKEKKSVVIQKNSGKNKFNFFSAIQTIVVVDSLRNQFLKDDIIW